MKNQNIMPTSELRLQIEQAISKLLPYFEVTDEELGRFQKPRIRRTLEDYEYPEHSRNCPGYSPIESFFYFPPKDTLLLGVFSPAIIYHEVGHYIHHSINPEEVKGVHQFLKTGIFPPGHCELSELVAEYGNFILGLRNDEDSFNLRTFQKRLRIYEDYGPEFLPRLARMSLEEAIREKIVII